MPPLALAGSADQAAWAPRTSAWVMGWGAIVRRLSPGGERYYADRLRDLQVPIVGDDACELAYGIGSRELPYLPAKLLCAGAADGRAGTCAGDSGGPLVVGEPDAWLAVGIVTGSDSCAPRGYYDLYTRVHRIRRFAVRASTAVQPDPLSRPRIRGALVAGRHVRCRHGHWGGSAARFSVRWTRPGSTRALGRGPTYRVRRRDARRGLRCVVTAVNRGGRNVIAARPLLPR